VTRLRVGAEAMPDGEPLHDANPRSPEAGREATGLASTASADEAVAARIAKPDIYSAEALASAVEIVTGAVSVEPSSLEVRRPSKHEFFRASPEERHWLQAQVLAIKDEDSGLKPDLYPVMPAVITHLMELTQPYHFVLAVNRRNTAAV
jgi:hypothetical protein